jgi:hypothetical protein
LRPAGDSMARRAPRVACCVRVRELRRELSFEKVPEDDSARPSTRTLQQTTAASTTTRSSSSSPAASTNSSSSCSICSLLAMNVVGVEISGPPSAQRRDPKNHPEHKTENGRSRHRKQPLSRLACNLRQRRCTPRVALNPPYDDFFTTSTTPITLSALFSCCPPPKPRKKKDERKKP